MVLSLTTTRRAISTPSGFLLADECEGSTFALTQSDHDAAFAGLVLWFAPVNAVFFLVRRPDRTALVHAVDLDFAGERCIGCLARHRFADFVAKNESRLWLGN